VRNGFAWNINYLIYVARVVKSKGRLEKLFYMKTDLKRNLKLSKKLCLFKEIYNFCKNLLTKDQYKYTSFKFRFLETCLKRLPQASQTVKKLSRSLTSS